MRAAALLLVVPLLVAAAPASSDQPRPGAWPAKIERWQGRVPTEKIGGASLLAQRGFAQGVTKLVGAAALKNMRTRWTTVSPVTRDGDFFLVQGCRKHACPIENYAVLVDRNHGVVGVCLGHNDGQALVKSWTGPDGRKPRETRESDTRFGCSGDPKRLLDEAKAFVLQTTG
jgi:hypothetical protein